MEQTKENQQKNESKSLTSSCHHVLITFTHQLFCFVFFRVSLVSSSYSSFFPVPLDEASDLPLTAESALSSSTNSLASLNLDPFDHSDSSTSGTINKHSDSDSELFQRQLDLTTPLTMRIQEKINNKAKQVQDDKNERSDSTSSDSLVSSVVPLTSGFTGEPTGKLAELAKRSTFLTLPIEIITNNKENMMKFIQSKHKQYKTIIHYYSLLL